MSSLFSWLYYWKGVLRLDLQEYLLLSPGELNDLIACYQIAEGLAKEKKSDAFDAFIPDLR